MQNPESYRMEHYDDSLEELIEERNRLADTIRGMSIEDLYYGNYHEYMQVICGLILWRLAE